MNSCVIDQSNFSIRMKHPFFVSPIKIRSSSTNKSYNDLYHTFALPIVGDYAHNFTLVSNYILKGMINNQVQVDCLGNYLDSVNLCLNQRTLSMSQIDHFPMVETLSPYSLNDKSVIKLEFLNIPLLIKCSPETTYLITLKFKQSPPIDYLLAYDVMHVDDPHYADKLQKEKFAVTYVSQQTSRTVKTAQYIFERGHVTPA
uniref:Uncharacterized protein n=1 Tax=viral metagenome TaxID=1070528 RepID=A0A6C0BJG6_9ZZZZ